MQAAATAFIALWYFGSIVNNVATKEVLRDLPFTLALSLLGLLCQFALGSFLSKKSPGGPKAPQPPLRVVLPLSVAQLIAICCHRLALLHGTVALVHTVKSLGTVFAALLAWGFLGHPISAASCLAILLAVAGVALAVNDKADLPLQASLYASGAALAESVRSVYTKLLLEEGFRRDDLFYRMEVYSMAIFVPIVAFLEGPALMQWESPLRWSMITASALGLCCMDASSFMVITLITPLSHALCNTLRSLVVISAGIAYFQLDVGVKFCVGCLLTVSGVTLHALSSLSGQKHRKEE
eukprot:Sspe_Gene.10277::Locus_3433_Transcript_1_1_Confidence_1.000_Length_1018::g.10277::m.10277/K15283/SLC35E1; solute carrier family 35, member E1